MRPLGGATCGKVPTWAMRFAESRTPYRCEGSSEQERQARELQPRRRQPPLISVLCPCLSSLQLTPGALAQSHTPLSHQPCRRELSAQNLIALDLQKTSAQVSSDAPLSHCSLLPCPGYQGVSESHTPVTGLHRGEDALYSNGLHLTA